MSKNTELAIILPKLDAALPYYSKEGGLDEFIEQVRKQVSGIAHDVTTRKGREAIASDAYKVAQSKSAIEKLGKDVSAIQKELPKKIDAERKRAFEELEKLQAETRRPLTEWEAAETARVEAHKSSIQAIIDLVTNSGETAEQLHGALAKVVSIELGEHWQEFEGEAAKTKDAAQTKLRALIEAREKYEAEQAELARLRKEAAEREKKDHEERIAREAADAAQRAAEAKVQADRDAAAKREAEAKAAQAKAEQDKIDAENALKAAEVKAEQDRLAAIAAQEKAVRDAENERLASEQRAKQAAENARLAEIQRQKDEQAQADAEAKAREANVKHKKAVNNAALDALVAGGIAPDCAKAVITLIAKGYIPAVKITY